MTMDMDPAAKGEQAPAKAEEKAPAQDAPEIDGKHLAYLVAALVDVLPECKSVSIEGLDGDAPKVVCTPVEGEPMSYDLDAAALEEAVAALAESESAEGEDDDGAAEGATA